MWNWLRTQIPTDRNQFEIFKIILDKGILTIIILIAGAFINVLMERYKSILVKQQQIQNITNPLITSMIAECDLLYEAGRKAIHDGSIDFREFEDWTDRLLSEPIDVSRLSMREFLEGPSVVVRVRGEDVTLEQFLLQSAPTTEITELVSSCNFWCNPLISSDPTSFLFNLFSANLARRGDSDVYKNSEACTHWAMARYFTGLNREFKKEYRLSMCRFNLAMIRNLYPGTRRQKRAFSNMLKTLEISQESMDDFPAIDVARYRGLTTYKRSSRADGVTANDLTRSHAALISLLAAYLRGS